MPALFHSFIFKLEAAKGPFSIDRGREKAAGWAMAFSFETHTLLGSLLSWDGRMGAVGRGSLLSLGLRAPGVAWSTGRSLQAAWPVLSWAAWWGGNLWLWVLGVGGCERGKCWASEQSSEQDHTCVYTHT